MLIARLQGRLFTDKGTRTRFANWIRKALDLRARGLRLHKRYEIRITALTESNQCVQFYCAYMVKDMGQPHHHNFFCGFTVEELLEWLVAYRQIRRSLTKDKILSDVDNLLQLVHDFYNARLYPLQVTFLTAATLYFQSGDSIINPSMLTKYPLDRERYESYWNAFCLQKPEDIKREDIQACLFGGRPVGDPDPNANREEVWDGYESDKNSDFELGRSKSMTLKKVEELSKLEYALRIQGGEHLDASRSHAVPRYDLSRHANGETYYTYAGIRIAGSEVDITEAFRHLRTNATDAGPPPPRSLRVDPPSQPTSPPRESGANNDDVQTLSYDHAPQDQNDAHGDTQDDDRSLSCVVNISVNSGFDRSQGVPDNAPVSAYREAMAAVGCSSRTRRAQTRNDPLRPIPPHLSQSVNEGSQSEDGDEDDDAANNDSDASV